MAYELPSAVRDYVTVSGTDVKIPLVTLTGGDGPRIVVTAGVHAGEYVGIQALVELARELEGVGLAGTVQLVLVANMPGFERRGTSMVPPDETNLNRVFPGRMDCDEPTLADRIAHTLMSELIAGADYYIDLHSGDYFEDLLPHLYYLADVEVSQESRRMAEHVDVRYVMPYTNEVTGNATTAAAVAGVPCVLIERGGLGVWSREEVERAKADVMNLLRYSGVVAGEARCYAQTQRMLPDMHSFYSEHTGFWYPARKTGDTFLAGDMLGELRDCFGRPIASYIAPAAGMVVYQTASLNVVKGGPVIAYALFGEAV